ncbi:MAG: GH25 family lysozyme [Chitinophagaceae bacterium]
MPPRKRKKSVRLRRIVFTVLAIVMIVAAAWMSYQWLQYRKARFTRYPEFGISIPEKYSIHGIDVSRYQQTIAWEEVQSMRVKNIQLGFAFIKATEGIGNTDPEFGRNWKKAKKNGIIRGAYHFFMSNKDGRMQAENFINKVELEPGDLPPVLDVEQLNGANYLQVRKEIRIWLDVVENYYHIKPIIYTNVDFYKRCLGDEFDQYPLWVAHYYQSQQPRIHRDWNFWQHNDEGRVNGIVSKVDFNVFNGDSTDFRNILIH